MESALLAGAVFIVSLTLCAALVPPTRVLGRRFGIVDQPGGRRVHSEPTPRLGGAAIVAAFLTIVLGGYWISMVLGESGLARSAFGQAAAMLREAWRVEIKLFGIVAGSLVVFLVGILDDLFGSRFPVLAKLFGQVLAAVIVVAAGVHTTFLPMEWMNVAVTILWIVAITNAFNLLDNMDGLAAGVAFVASLSLFINAWSLGTFFVCLILAAFMGSLLGFLLYNFHPASVFMGDGGSLFIGFAMATITLLETYVSKASSSLFPVLMPVLVLAVPIVDTVTVVIIRSLERRPIYVGDQRHISHRLVALGFSRPSAVLVIYLVTLCLGLGAVSLVDATPFQSGLILLQAVVFVSLLLLLMFAPGRVTDEVTQ
jgi:UDP-GlcNAc:undecaprenyl-phosphate/decaprenyl-phosphate GlcNAc-1-phosphate transferase